MRTSDMGASVRVETRFQECISKSLPATVEAQIARLRELSARVGSDPLLTQASTGNSSIKLGGRMWIKASGKWMADALREEILIALDLAAVRASVKHNVDPAARHSNASIETAMHAVMPHRVVLHAHCVNTIAWAVRQDAWMQLERRLEGLRWQWIPYVPSGLPLATKIEQALSRSTGTEVFVLGNHGLVVGGEDCDAVEALLAEVERRVSIRARDAQPADYEALEEFANGSAWGMPEDADVHALGTDAVSREVLSRGFLYPCQAVLANSNSLALFQTIRRGDRKDPWKNRKNARPFCIIEDCGVVVSRAMAIAERKMISGLAQVVQRIHPSAPLRYLTGLEVAQSRAFAESYRDRSRAGRRESAP